jgi:hypothetical protein
MHCSTRCDRERINVRLKNWKFSYPGLVWSQAVLVLGGDSRLDKQHGLQVAYITPRYLTESQYRTSFYPPSFPCLSVHWCFSVLQKPASQSNQPQEAYDMHPIWRSLLNQTCAPTYALTLGSRLCHRLGPV